MTDDEESRTVKVVSDFLRRSCRMRPTHRFSFANVFCGLSYAVVHPVDGTRCKVFPVSTGSAAEFYIEPMLSCVDDMDAMYHYSNELATPAWHPPPSRLPPDFKSRVKVYEIVDSHLPGYVYLNLTYVLIKNECDGNYSVTEYVSSQNTCLLYTSPSPRDS